MNTKKQENPYLGSVCRRSFMLFAVVPMAFAFLICFVIVNGSYQATIRRDTEADIRGISEKMQDMIDETLQIVIELSNDNEIINQVSERKTLSEEYNKLVNTILLGHNDILQIHILSVNGLFRYSTGAIPTLFKLPDYQGAFIFKQLNAEPYVVRATKYYSYSGKQIAYNIGTCIRDENDCIIGYVIADIKYSSVVGLLQDNEMTYINSLVMTDNRNVVAFKLNHQAEEGLTVKETTWTVQKNSGWITADSYVQNIQGLKMYITVNQGYYRSLMIILIVGLSIMILLALTIAYSAGTIVSKRITKQFSALVDLCKKSPETGFTAAFVRRKTDYAEVVQLGEYVNEMNQRTKTLISNIEEKQKLLASTEMNMLKAQMRPHFFYNVLNDLKAMAKLNKTKEIVQMVICFSTLIRSSISSDEEMYTVSEELELVNRYVEMQNLRGQKKINLKIKVDDSLLENRIPRLILQPLVENAAIHGLPQKTNPQIYIQGIEKETAYEYWVVDNGCGMGCKTKWKENEEGVFHQSMGLENIQKRLKLYYGESSSLEIVSSTGHYTKIIIRIPK